MYIKRNVLARPRNHFCCGKVVLNIMIVCLYSIPSYMAYNSHLLCTVSVIYG
jgi:hypothetical protein